MRVKVSDAEREVLNWLVAQAEGMLAFGYLTDGERFAIENSNGKIEAFMPSSFWVEGGPIIEREGIALLQRPMGYWVATSQCGRTCEGDTPLIAAMRCYVASKLGDEVDVPDDLLEAA